jgi:hypothetical protein
MSDNKNIINAPSASNLCPTLFPNLGKKPTLTVNSKLPSACKASTRVSPNNIHLNAKPNLNINSNKTIAKPNSDNKPIIIPIEDLPFVPIKSKNANESDNSSDCDSSSESENDTTSNVPLITELTLSKKETYHYKIIDKYYRSLDMENVLILIDIVEKKSKVSLRLIDWFVTKYSHKYKVRLDTIDTTRLTNVDNGFNVHISYKAQLQSYKKKYFDPFRRRKRLKFRYFFDKEKKVSLCTTIGQLNFFKWAFTNNIVSYVLDNYEAISKAMTQSNKLDKAKKNGISNSDTSNVSDIVSQPNGVNSQATDNTSNDRKKVVVKREVKKQKKPGLSKQVTHESMSLKF